MIMQGLHCDPVLYWAQMYSLHKMESLLDNSLVKFSRGYLCFQTRAAAGCLELLSGRNRTPNLHSATPRQ